MPVSQPARKVHIGIDLSTARLVAMKRVKFDEKLERELLMLCFVANLSDVPWLQPCGLIGSYFLCISGSQPGVALPPMLHTIT